MGRYVSPRNDGEHEGGERRPAKEPYLSIFATCFFPFKRGEDAPRDPLGPPPLYLRHRESPPAASQDFFVPNYGANNMAPRRRGKGARTGGRRLVRIRNRGKKCVFFNAFFRARGEQAIVLARRPNIDSESAIWRRIWLPKQRPTAAGERCGGGGVGGSPAEKGVDLVRIRATHDSSQPMHAPFRALSANALLFKTLKNSNTQLHRYTSTRLFSTTPSNPSALVNCNTSTRLFYIQ